MANIGWGKAGIYLCDLDVENSEWIQAPTPVENSINLTPTKGSKQEAKLEGGENEDVRYGANNYALAYQIRRAKNKEMPIKHIDGIVAHNYGVIVVPADDKVPSACYIERSVVSVEDAFSTQEGGTDLYTLDAVKPDDGSRMVKWGQITVTKDNATGKITKIVAKGEDFGEGEKVIYTAPAEG